MMEALNGIQCRGQAILLANGDRLWNIVIWDVTELKTANNQIKEIKDQLDLAVKTAHLGVWQVYFSKNDMVWNDEVLDVFGLTKKEFNKDKSVWKGLVHPDDWGRVRQAAIDAANGQRVLNVNFRVTQPGGALRYVQTSTSPTTKNEKVTGLVGHYISGRHSLGKKLNKTCCMRESLPKRKSMMLLANNEALKKANQELDNFVYRVSHDLRSPITSAIGLSQISLKSTDIEEIEQLSMTS